MRREIKIENGGHDTPGLTSRRTTLPRRPGRVAEGLYSQRREGKGETETEGLKS